MTVSANSYAKETAYRLRLSNLIKPSIQQINLKVDPDSPTFKGGTTITIDVTKATDTVFFTKKT